MSNEISPSTFYLSILSCDTSRENFLATLIDHPKPTKADSKIIRYFFSSYNQYMTEVVENSKQIISYNMATTEAIPPVKFKFIVDAEWVQS